VINIALLTLLGITALIIARLTNLFAVVMLSGLYSLISASLFVTLDAVDVALTEAAVGAGIATVLLVMTLSVTRWRAKPSRHGRLLPLAVVVITGSALIYGTLDMPHFGDPEAPPNQHVAPRYLEQGPKETGIPNIVTAVLASYRGLDTLGEVVVVFTAVVGVLALLGSRARRPEREEEQS